MIAIKVVGSESLDVGPPRPVHLWVPEITGEHLVCALSTLHDLDMLRNTFSQQKEGYRILSHLGLGHVIDRFRQSIQHLVVWHMNLVVPGGITFDDLVGKLKFMTTLVRMIFKTDGKCEQVTSAVFSQ